MPKLRYISYNYYICGMTLQEAITDLRSQNKPYHDVKMKQPYFSQMLKKIESGHCKPITVNYFMGRFGYTISQEEQWEKQ